MLLRLDGVLDTIDHATDFVISREFDAPRELVSGRLDRSRAPDPMVGAGRVRQSGLRVDPRVGGACRIVMRGADGSEYPIAGVFPEVDAPARLVMTMDVSGHPEAWYDAA